MHGLQGWQYIDSYCEEIKDLLSYGKLLLLEQPGGATAKPEVIQEDISLETLKKNGKRFITRLTGTDSPQQAANQTNLLLGVRRSQLPPPPANKYYWHDLVGARVTSLYLGREIMLGTISRMERYAANDNMVVQGDAGKLHYIPFVQPDYVSEIQVQQDPWLPPNIKVNWDPDF